MQRLKISKQITKRDSEALERYLSDIAKTKLLTPEQEVELAAKAKKGNKQALEELIKANLRFVVSVAKQYQNKGLSLADLISEGNIGLIKAAMHFDETRGFKFISYAVWWIRQSIMQALAEKSRHVRLPVNKIGIQNRVRQIILSLQQELNREPTQKEIAEALEIDEKFVREILEQSELILYLDSPMGTEDTDLKLIDIITDNSYYADTHINEEENKKMIEKLLNTLPPRDSEIIRMYYGIGKNHKYTLEEIGSYFKLTRERVRQIKNKAMHELRRNAKEILNEY